MRVYFLAEKPCALFAGGLALGTVDGFERTVELDVKDGIFCELKAAGMLPVGFVFNEEFLLSPPPQITLYFVKEGVAIYCSGFFRADPSPKVLWQERLNGARLTLLLQGRLLLDFTNGKEYRLLVLPDYLETCKPYAAGSDILLQAEEGFAIISERGELRVVSEGHVIGRENGVRAEIPFHDSMGHSALCLWENGALKECSIRSANEPTEATLALALCESVLIGAETDAFLSEKLAQKAGLLREFFGNFTSVVLTNEPTRVGLTYPRSERVYDVRYFRFTEKEGKICNIAPE